MPARLLWTKDEACLGDPATGPARRSVIEMGEARVGDGRQQLRRAACRRAAASAGFAGSGPAGQPTRPRNTPTGNREAEPGSSGFNEP